MPHTIDTTTALGELIRRERKHQGLRQPDLAAAAGTSVRFIVEVERGKPTAQIGKVLDVLRQLGLSLALDGLSAPPAEDSAENSAGNSAGNSADSSADPGEGSAR